MNPILTLMIRAFELNYSHIIIGIMYLLFIYTNHNDMITACYDN